MSDFEGCDQGKSSPDLGSDVDNPGIYILGHGAVYPSPGVSFRGPSPIGQAPEVSRSFALHRLGEPHLEHHFQVLIL
jgi:hypothetical protein